MFRSIRMRIVAYQAFFIVFLALICGIGTYFFMVDSLIETEREKLENIVKNEASELETLIGKKMTLVREACTEEDLQTYIERFEEKVIIERFIALTKEFSSIAYIDARGREELKLVNGERSYELFNISKTGIYQKMNKKPNEVVASFHTPTNDPANAYVEFGILRKNYFDEFLGIITAKISLYNLSRTVQGFKMGKTGFVLLMDKNKRILSYPRSEHLLEKVKTEDVLSEKFISDAAAMKKGFMRAKIVDTDGYVAYTPLKELEWTVLAVMPYKEFIKEPNTMRNVVIVFSLLILVLGLLASLAVANSINKPISELAKAAELLGQGDLSRRAGIESDNEIGILTRSFNRMADELESSFDVLNKEICERKKTEEKIMEREHYFRSILYAMHEEIIVIDRDYCITDVNNALLQNIGKMRMDVIGHKCYEILHGLDGPCGERNKECMLEKAFKTGRYTQYMREIVEMDGSKKWLDIILSPLKDDKGNTVQMIQTVRDVSEIVKTQEMLRRYEHIVSTCTDLLSFIDKNYVYRAINKAYTEAFGKKEVEILNHTITDVFGRELFEERIKPRIDRAFAGERFQYQAWFDFPGWGRTYLDTVFHPYFGEDNKVEGVVVCARNSTDFKNLEVQLTQAQKLEAIGRLAAGIAHEINTPMQYIGDNAGFLKDSFAEVDSLFNEYKKFLNEVKSRSVLPEEVSRMEEVVQKADFEFLAEEIPSAIQQSLEGIERVVKIVRAMKEFSHPGLDERRPIDLNHAVESTITVSRNEWKYVAEMETDFDKDMPNVVCLPGEFKQVILNLIVNAAHAIGDVVQSGGNGNKGTIRISTRYEEDCAVVRISDTGSGIPEEVRDKIFNPFFTTKEVGKGTGQGLAIAHSVITKKHKGKISFETEMGKGTTFTISLPIEEKAEKREEVKKA